MGTNTVVRSLNDVGLAAWFGSSLMGAVGLNGAAASLPDPRQQATVAQAGWDRWAPVGAAAVAAHLVGGTLLVPINKGRLVAQRGPARTSAPQTVLTFAALAATLAARSTGKRIAEAAQRHAGSDTGSGTGAGDGAVPGPDLGPLTRRLRALQWAVPLLTGGSLVLNARLGELQRPTAVAGGIARRLLPWR